MFWCLVRLSTGVLSGSLYANPLGMAIQSAVTCSEMKVGGLLVSWQLLECSWFGLHPPVLQWKVAFFLIKGAIRDCLQSSSLRREPPPTRTLKRPGRNRVQITCNTSSAYRVQHVVLRATWYEGTAQLLSSTELKSHLFELYVID